MVHLVLRLEVRERVVVGADRVDDRETALRKARAYVDRALALDPTNADAHSASSLAGNPTPLTLGAIAYLILFIPFVLFGRWVESRFAWKR